MTEQIREQITLFCMAVYTGLVMAFVYDFIRIYRKLKNSKVIEVWIQDITYWLVFVYVAYSLLLKYNYGGIRAYAFVGIIAGMGIYFLTVSRIFVKYMSLMLEKIMNTMIKALKIVVKPIKLGLYKLKFHVNRVIECRREIKLEKKCKEDSVLQDGQAREAGIEDEATTVS